MSSTSQKVSKSVLFQILNLVFTGLSGIIILPFILDSFGVEKYGIFELIISLLVIDTFLEFGVGGAIIKYTPNFKSKGGFRLNDFFWTFTYVKSIFSLIAFFLVIYIAFNFSSIFSEIPKEYNSQIKTSCFIFAFGLILKNISVVRGIMLKGLLRFDYALGSDIIANICYFFIVFILLKIDSNFGLVELSLMLFIFTPLLKGVLYTFWLHKLEPSISFLPKKWDKEILKETYKYMGGMTLISLVAKVFGQGNRFILGIISNPISLAVYGVAEKIRKPIINISSSILRPLIPASANIDFNNKQALFKKILSIARIESIIVFGTASLIILITPELLKVWLSGRLPEATIVIQVWLLPLLFPKAGVMLMFYYGQGKTKASLIINIIGTIINFVLALILHHYFDLLGFILGLSISTMITSVIGLVYFCSFYEIKLSRYIFEVSYIPFLSIAGITGFYFFLKQFFIPNNWGSITLILILLFTLYSIITFLLLSRNERSFFIKHLNPFVGK
ncbi:MAG: O-antigen/teichoic acid export membrane protein [Mariniflexile sp.]|jgi:O-antigen/teichoic acid export membrane protein